MTPDWTACWWLIGAVLFTVVHLCGPVWIGWIRASRATDRARATAAADLAAAAAAARARLVAP